MDYDNAIMTALQIITTLKNLPRKIKRLIHKTKRVEIIENNTVHSVHNKFNLICLLRQGKIKNKIDISTNRIQFIKQMGGIDRHLILENTDGNNAIQNGINFIKQNKQQLKNIIISPTILIKCNLINNGKNVDIKKILMRYALNSDKPNLLIGHTIRNILDFNKITYDSNTILEISKIINNNVENERINIETILNNNVISII
jgi:hypothetical protein